VPVRARTLALLAVLLAAAALLTPAAIADDRRSDLSRTQDELGRVEAVLRDARADSAAVASALATADQAVAAARGRLDVARDRLDAARQRSVQTARFAARVAAELADLRAGLAERARGAYMTGGSADLAVLVDPEHLPELLARATTLDYIAQAGSDSLSRLRGVQRQAAELHQRALEVERARRAAGEAVARDVTDLERVKAVRARAKQALDGRIARLAGQAAALRSRSTELRRLIRQEEAERARQAAAQRASGTDRRPPVRDQPVREQPVGQGPGGLCDLSGVSSAERWIIMRESGGDPRADNPTSTAFGLGQLLLGNRILYLGADYATIDCGKQLQAFRTYVRDRYGTAEAAMAFWQSHGWY
jgi:septal ring factor EnvC (AmiA/AmiB activator)